MEKNCNNCAYFEERTRFCRLNPPQPMTMVDADNYEFLTSKFPKIQNPILDFCSFWKFSTALSEKQEEGKKLILG